jgi:hypothetical protein
VVRVGMGGGSRVGIEYVEVRLQRRDCVRLDKMTK